jgi:broad specificity phosphatase PhoE
LKTTTLYLLRHGATAANEQRPYVLQGDQTDGPLSPTGRNQAAAVADFLQDHPINHIYCSPLKRAIETAQAIADRHGLVPSYEPRLSEVHVGRWEGLAWKSIMERFPEEYRRFMDNPADTPYLEGESYRDVRERAQPAVDDILGRHQGELVLIVAHNVVNRSLLAELLGLELRLAKSIRQSNTGINVIRDENGNRELITLNACFHLDGI